jgi:hypothetical protein
MKDYIIRVLDIWEKLKTVDLVLGIAIIGIFLIIAVSKSKTRRKLLIDIPIITFNLYKTAIFQNKIIGTVFLFISIASTITVYFLTQSITTTALFLVMPFKTILKELKTIAEDKNKSIAKIFMKIFWDFEKSFLGYSITYYLVLLKLPTELKKIIIYGYDNFKEGVMNGDLDIIILLALLSVVVSLLISIFITEIKRFAIIEQDILLINRKSKYKGLSKAQIHRVVVGTSYFKNVKVKVEILRVIAGFNKYDFKDFRKLLKSSMQLYSFLRVKASDRKQFLNFLDKFLHCRDKYDTCKDAVKQIKKGSRQKAINLMNSIDEFWDKECMQYICYNKKQECLTALLKAVQN